MVTSNKQPASSAPFPSRERAASLASSPRRRGRHRRHCEERGDEAIHLYFSLQRFSLPDGLPRGAYHRAHVRATRWFATTNGDVPAHCRKMDFRFMPRLTLLSLQVLVAVVALVLWQLFATVPVFGHILLPPFFFSNPADVGRQIAEWFTTGVIWKHLAITLWESILAFVIGSLGGAAVGFWFARKPLVAAVFDPYVKMANALPRVVLAPIFALWLGLGIWSKVALGVTLVFFIVFFNVYQGVKEVSTTVLDNGR